MAVAFLLLTVLYLALQSKPVQSFLVHRLTTYLSGQLKTKIHVGGINVAFFRRVVLEDVWIEDQQADTLVWVHRASAKIDSFSIRKNYLAIGLFTFDQTKINLKKDTAGVFNFSFLTDSLAAQDDSPGKWRFYCQRFSFKKATIRYLDGANPPAGMNIDDIHLRIDRFVLKPDSMRFHLASLSMNDSKGFYLNDLSANITQVSEKLTINNLRFQTLNSEVDSARLAISRQDLPGSLDKVVDIDLDIFHSNISFADIAKFVPQLEGMDMKLQLSGKVSGNIENLKAKNLTIKTGALTEINCDFSISNLPGFNEPFLFLDLRKSQTDFRDLKSIKLPQASGMDFLSFPESFYKAGIISYQGNFTGFPSDFVAFGTINSNMGQVKTDLSFVPEQEGKVKYNGKLVTEGFNLGQLFQEEQLGKLSFNGMVNGAYDKQKDIINGRFNGTITDWFSFGYNYQNIHLNGELVNKKFDGSVKVDDPNLQLDFAGVLNLNEKIPAFDFTLKVDHADLNSLKLDTIHSVSILTIGVAANFSGNSLDNLDGQIHVTNGKYINPNDTLNFETLQIITHLGEKISVIELFSDFFDASISGKYHFQSLPLSFSEALAHFLPALSKQPISHQVNNSFTFELNVKELDEITAVFFPDLKVNTPFSLNGKIDSYLKIFELTGDIPGLTYHQLALRNAHIQILPDKNELSAKVKFDEIRTEGGYALYNVAFQANAGKNKMKSRMTWNNWDRISYSGEIETEITLFSKAGQAAPRFEIEIMPSKVYVADSLWHIMPASVGIDSSAIALNNLNFRSGNQEISINGKLSHNRSDQLSLSIKDIDLQSFESYLGQQLGLKGSANGTVGIYDFYGTRLFYSDLQVNNLEFRSQIIGNVNIGNKWDRETGMIDAELKISRNNRNQAYGRGFYNPFSKNMNFTFDFDNLSLVLLETVIRENLSNIHGDATGRMTLSGTPDKILMDGAIFCQNAGLTIDFTQVSYHLNDTIRLSGDSIIFRRIGVRDILNNRGTFDGSIRHDNFSNMDYNMTVTTNRLLALNTTIQDNGSFYGRAVARGVFRITGKGQNIRMQGEATTLSGTSVTIVLGDDDEVTKYDFIRWVSPAASQDWKPGFRQPVSTGGTELDLNVTVTPDARAQLIYNTTVSDLIRAQGEGVLRFSMDKAGNMFLSGNFNVTQGEYLFTLQNVINKRFSIEPGGSMVWSGDPYEAVIDISAIYKLKASLYELFAGGIHSVDISQRIPVDCKIILTNDLSNPDISFDIVFPTIEDRLKDEMQQFFNTQEEMNKQMLSLLVLGRFYTPEYMRGTYEAANTNLIGNTASDLFSNQLSNWLSQITRDVDIGINYRRGNQLTNDEIEFALSTQIFNDRVTINGNIGNNANPNSINNSQLVGDFDINVKLTPNGKLQLKAYNRSNNNLIYETAPYTQGLGISYREDFNSFNELWKKFGTLFRREQLRYTLSAPPQTGL